MISIPAWLFILVCVVLFGGFFLGIWAASKFASRGGFSFVRPSEPKSNGKPSSYVKDLFASVGEPIEEDLSEAAKRIRDQKLQTQGPLADVIRDVEGLS